jgi:uncharacterized protein YjbI with pentapeptide repeats
MGQDQQPDAQQDTPQDRWGDVISDARKAELQAILDVWNAPDADHGDRTGPFDVRGQALEERKPRILTGADVFWLAELARADFRPGFAATPYDLDWLEVTDAIGALSRLLADLRWTDAAQLMDLPLAGPDMSALNLEGAHLRRAQLDGANLVGGRLDGADLAHAHLDGADLSKAHLKDAHLLGAHLDGAKLTQAHLDGADLAGAHLDGVDLS